ncbi:reverse transcriptase zinc-binding domain-containing protein [Artemisia annua]|uniref:Reverse transcriptase zinc-binding domain-containing protein n=1 Tax=Artemisia annua TaxID=35608 RepID=A0A2U1N9Y0_ARTAN|nr:reverse transcriptase zinc-binding domain-containing protein [Artemisia annua]
MENFPPLYMLETNKECKGSDRWCHENEEWHVLSPDSRGVLDPSGKFSVKALSCLVESKSIGVGETNQNFIWNPWVPRKVYVSIWRASMDRLPSRANLLIRSVEIASARCNMALEKSDSACFPT